MKNDHIPKATSKYPSTLPVVTLPNPDIDNINAVITKYIDNIIIMTA